MQAGRSAGIRHLAVSVLLFAAAVSYAPGMRAEGRKACTKYLTAAEVDGALGRKLEAAEPVEYSEGFTVCSWSIDRPEGALGVNLSVFEMKAIREGMVSAESVPEFFDLQVSSKRDQAGADPEKLDSYGRRVVLFTEDTQWTVMIEGENAFVHLSISPGDVTRSQVDKVVEAVVARLKK